jgi:membrane protease YdiL (CAAX protease family)
VGDAVFACLVAALIVAQVATGGEDHRALTIQMVKDAAGFYVTVAILFAVVAFARGQSPQQAFGLAPPRPLHALFTGVACIVLAFPLVEGVGRLTTVVVGHSLSEGDPTVNYLLGSIPAGDLAWTAALVLVIGPVTEELVFRGYLYGVIKKYGGRLAGMATSSLLFAALHPNVPAMPFYFVLAMSFALAYEITGSLWTPIVMHMTFNLVPMIVILYFPQWIDSF